MADKYVQLKDNNGNNLYPAVADFPLSAANGGTGITDFGTIYTAAFTANSASAIWAQISDTITLQSGKYLLIATIPITSTTTGAFAITDSNNTIIGSRFNSAPSYSTIITLVTFNTTTVIKMAWQASASCNFSYKERGGLQAVKLG